MKILVLKLTSLEETILSTPLFNSLKKSFPDSQIDLVTYEENLEIISGHKSINHIFSIKKEDNFFSYLFFSLKVLGNKYDAIIDLTGNKKSGLFGLFSFGVKYKVRKDKNRIFNFRYKNLIPCEERYYDEVEKNLRFLEPIYEKENIKGVYDKEITLNIREHERENIKNRMKEEGIDVSIPIFACSVYPKSPYEVYPLDEMKKIVENLSSENYTIVLYFEEENEENIKKFYDKLGNKKNIKLFKINNLIEYRGFFANCKFFFGNECCERYIAQGLEVPSFIIFNNQETWIANYGERFQGIINGKITKSYFGITEDRVYGEISSEDIIERIKRMIK
ncbi:glycosyltransferase family 9 protein [Fusobacterium sp.]|uniref:glycosyltransferase family 9 protein n=1 Tax=Fusobacterium sp. TaxID=68766 RepID=UPI002611A406|nr:glycosyltransferase family 9 protein [Fusobacterium sp.]